MDCKLVESGHHSNDYSDNSDSDYEDEPSAALPIEVSQIQTDSSGPPRNGHEYLQQVQIERKRFPKVAVAPRSSFQNKTRPGRVVKPSHQINETFMRSAILLPEEVQEVILETFLDTRKIIESHSAKHSNLSTSSPGTLPNRVDMFDEHPKISQLVHLDQLGIHNLLQAILELMENRQGFIAGPWLYALMAFLKEPLESDIYSSLRRISRLSSQVRKVEDPTSEKWISSSIIILLIGKHFCQRDLLD